MQNPFQTFWSEFGTQTLSERRDYFNSLDSDQKTLLIRSFKQDGWDRFFAAIYIDHLIDRIKKEFKIDLIDLRVKAIKFRKVFLIDTLLWERIEELICEWSDFYDIDIIFGGLQICRWGKSGQFCKIRAKKHLNWR